MTGDSLEYTGITKLFKYFDKIALLGVHVPACLPTTQLEDRYPAGLRYNRSGEMEGIDSTEVGGGVRNGD